MQNMIFREIHTTDSAYAQVERLWLTAFPEAERRDTAAQQANTDTQPNFHCLVAEDTHMVGFLTYWDFGAFCYVEHFATLPSVRNSGYGSAILREVLCRAGKPIVLEVESPDTELSQRRVHFYERNGLTLWQVPYIQPAYRAGGESVPMFLMATAPLSAEHDFPTIRRTLYSEVYGCQE